MNSNHMFHYVQHNWRFFVVVFIPLLGMLVVSLAEQFFFLTEVLVFLLLVVVLEFRNDKLLYNNTGIIVCSFVKGTFFVSWSDIVVIERASFYPFVSRLGYETLKIVYTVNGKTRVIRYDVYTYTGLPELLTFYYQVISGLR